MSKNNDISRTVKFSHGKITNATLDEFDRQYTNVVHWCVNRLLDSDGTVDNIWLYSNAFHLNKVMILDAHLINCAVQDSIAIYESYVEIKKQWVETRDKRIAKLDRKLARKSISVKVYNRMKKRAMEDEPKLIFGTRDIFIKRCKGKITKEEYKLNRRLPLYSIGQANDYGNRRFRICDDYTIELTFPIRHFKADEIEEKEKYMEYISHFDFTPLKFKLTDLTDTHKFILDKCKKMQDDKSIALTYRLGIDYLAMTYNVDKVFDEVSEDYTPVKNRVMAIDKNPNYIGYSVVEWKDSRTYVILETGVINLKEFSDALTVLNKLGDVESDDPRRIRIYNKREHEIIEVSKHLCLIAQMWQCEIFAVEDLNMPSKDRQKGKNYNALVNNNWLRNILDENIEKRTHIMNIKFLKVKCQYSSFVGNFLFRHLLDSDGYHYPDMVLSAIEISRRGYEFHRQYCLPYKGEHVKNIIQPLISDFEELYVKSLEEFEIETAKGKDFIWIYNKYFRDPSKDETRK